MKIRAARIDDIAGIQGLNRELDGHHAGILPGVFRRVDGDARPESVVREWIEDPEADYLVAELEGKIIGYLNLRKSANPKYPMFLPHEYAMIENAVVEKSQRGKGVGAKMFDAAIAWAAERGLEYVQTMVWSANEGAREFYLRRGFKPVMERLELDLRKGGHDKALKMGVR